VVSRRFCCRVKKLVVVTGCLKGEVSSGVVVVAVFTHLKSKDSSPDVVAL